MVAEKSNLTLRGGLVEQAAVPEEADVGHPVGFVENYRPNVAQIEGSLFIRS